MNKLEPTIENIIKYVEDNPNVIYAGRDEAVPDEFAQNLLDGDFNAAADYMSEVEGGFYQYDLWSYWNAEFCKAFGLDSLDDLDDDLRGTIYERQWLDTEDYWRACMNNYRGNVVATLIKRNGEYIEFPCTADLDDKDNRKLARYLKEACGITGDSEALYAGTVMKVLGRVDLYEIWTKGRGPKGLIVSDGDFTIGHHPNGSGTACNDKYQGKPRFYKAYFRVDNLDRYGVEQTFGFVDRVWSNELQLKF